MPAKKQPVLVDSASEEWRELQKSYFEVLGKCCPSEIPLIERTLKPLEGVHKVSVSVLTKTVTVVHNSLLISQTEIVKALNQARLDASVRSYGGKSASTRSWPSLYTVGSALLLIPSLFKGFYTPLQYFALAAVIVGLPPVILKSYAVIQRLVLHVNILLLIAVGGAVGLGDYQEAGTTVLLFTFAEWLESRASDKARDMVSSLMKEMMPQTATIAETGAVVHPSEVNLDTVLLVKAGEVIPIDGVVVDGRSEVDEKSLTWESTPVEKNVGSHVWGGTMNLTAVVIASVGLAVLPAILRAHNLQHWIYLKPSCADEGEDDRRRGVTMGYVMVDGKLAGDFGLCDECRPRAKAVVQQLRSMGIKTAMLTGDSQVAAMHVQEKLGNAIDFVHAELLPAKRVSIIEDLKKLGPTAMVGDGMNDAPALATATVGITMGVSGSAIATETSHVKIAIAIKLGRITHCKIIQNIVLSVLTKAMILGLAFGGHPRLWAAILADVGTCLLVIFNSMLLLQGHSHLVKCSSQAHTPHKHATACASCDGHTKHTFHMHVGCFSCAWHFAHKDSSHGTCKYYDTCKSTAKPSTHSEDHGQKLLVLQD